MKKFVLPMLLVCAFVALPVVAAAPVPKAKLPIALRMLALARCGQHQEAAKLAKENRLLRQLYASLCRPSALDSWS